LQHDETPTNQTPKDTGKGATASQHDETPKPVQMEHHERRNEQAGGWPSIPRRERRRQAHDWEPEDKHAKAAGTKLATYG